MAFLNHTQEGEAEVISLDPAERAVELVEAQYPFIDPDDDGEPETEGSESMEYITEPAEDTTPQQQVAQPKATRRRGVSRLLAEAISSNPGLTQSEYQRALGMKSPIATMAKRLVEKGIIVAKQDGRHVRYFPGNSPYTEVAVGRKPATKPAATVTPKESLDLNQRYLQPRWMKGWNIVTITGESGDTKRFVRIDENWYEMIPSNKPELH